MKTVEDWIRKAGTLFPGGPQKFDPSDYVTLNEEEVNIFTHICNTLDDKRLSALSFIVMTEQLNRKMKSQGFIQYKGETK